MRWNAFTKYANACTLKLQVTPTNPLGSSDSQFLASKEVPIRALQQSFRPPIFVKETFAGENACCVKTWVLGFVYEYVPKLPYFKANE
jgi:hypothetical protein